MGLHDQWYKNAIIYCLDVETYADSNGDGVGDFPGLTRRLDYISGLGVTCIWLMPMFPTPGGDDGYDVADYCTIDPRLGTMADFAEFMVEAEERGMHVIVDMVPNHTSIEHPWFQASRSDKKSPYRDYYVWRTDDPGDTSSEVVFPGEQKGIWTFDEAAKAWYLHRFYPFQPDLNWSNPAVRDEFRKVMGLWLKLGVHGFRIDAAPFLQDEQGGPESAHVYLRELKEFAAMRTGNAVLLGEVDVGLATLADYFGSGNELQALFNFPLNRYVFLGLAQRSADPIKFGLGQQPTIPGAGQWVNFLRHHDELNLSRLTREQREQVFEAFGPEPEHQVYDRGLRRRLAPMLGNDPAHLRLAYTLLFSLPGAPMLFYGEEIGMGENMELPGRMSVRGPMQWTSSGNGGFSSTTPKKHVRPMLTGGEFGHEAVSVGKERGERDSLLNWMAGLTRARRECGEIGTGDWSALDTGNDAVLGLRYNGGDSAIVTLCNLSPAKQSSKLELTEEEQISATELFADAPYPDPDGKTQQLNGFGFRWLRIGGIY